MKRVEFVKRLIEADVCFIVMVPDMISFSIPRQV